MKFIINVIIYLLCTTSKQDSGRTKYQLRKRVNYIYSVSKGLLSEISETWITEHIKMKYTLSGKHMEFAQIILYLSEMYPFFVFWRVCLTSEVVRSKLLSIAILSVAIFTVIAIIACTAAKAFEEQTWTAFAILLVTSIQVFWK